MKKWFIAAGFFMAMSSAGLGHAAEQAASAEAPPAVVGNLQAIIGHWTGTAKMKVPEQEEQILSVTVDCSETAGGAGLLCQDTMTGAGMNYLETDLIGHDARTGQVRWFSLASSGEMYEYVGKWNSEKKFSANYTGQVAGRSVLVDISMELTEASGLIVQSAATVAGNKAQSMTTTLMKSKDDKEVLKHKGE